MDNIINIITNHNLLLIHRIINHNLLNIRQDRRTQQACSKNDYDRDKVVKHGNIYIIITIPDKKIPIIPL